MKKIVIALVALSALGACTTDEVRTTQAYLYDVSVAQERLDYQRERQRRQFDNEASDNFVKASYDARKFGCTPNFVTGSCK